MPCRRILKVFHSVPEGTLVLQVCTYIFKSSCKLRRQSSLRRLSDVIVGHNFQLETEEYNTGAERFTGQTCGPPCPLWLKLLFRSSAFDLQRFGCSGLCCCQPRGEDSERGA